MERYVTHAVTLDFHDTLFLCDEWFQLEVRELPIQFLAWLADQPGQSRCERSQTEITSFYRQLRHTCIESGIEVDSLQCVAQVCRAFDVEVDQDLIATGVDHLMRGVLGAAQPRPGAAELVRTLKKSGVKLGVISNAIHHPFLEWALEKSDMLHEFDVVVSSASAGYYKSRVELYQLASKLLGVAADDTFHIGDSYRFDVVGASNAGMHTVWLNLAGAEIDGCQPDLVVGSLDGLAPLLFDRFSVGHVSRPGSTHAL